MCLSLHFNPIYFNKRHEYRQHLGKIFDFKIRRENEKKNPMRATGHCPDELVHYYDIFNGPGNCVATSMSR